MEDYIAGRIGYSEVPDSGKESVEHIAIGAVHFAASMRTCHVINGLGCWMVAFERIKDDTRWSAWFVKNVDWSKEHMAKETRYPAR